MAENLPDPASRTESYLAKAAGMDVTIPEQPESRLEQYLDAIAEGGGGGGGTSNFNELSNRPKYNGVAMTGDTDIEGTKALTEADYNWNASTQTTENPDCVALWLLEDGSYYAANIIKSAYGPNQTGFGYERGSFEISSTTEPSPILTDVYKYILNLNGTTLKVYGFEHHINDSHWYANTEDYFPLSSNVSTMINSKIQTTWTAPDATTWGADGMLEVYLDNSTTPSTPHLYMCAGGYTDPDTQSWKYSWVEVGGSSVNVVQTTGQSTSDVMSQKAVTDIIGNIETALHAVNNGGNS